MAIIAEPAARANGAPGATAARVPLLSSTLHAIADPLTAMTDPAPTPHPCLVSYRRVLYAERLEFFETAAGNAWTMAMTVAFVAFFLWFKRYLALDSRLEFAGSLVVALIGVFWFGRHLRLQVVVDEAQIQVDFAGLRRRAIDVVEVVSLRVVQSIAKHEWQDRNWRRHNGWSCWFSGASSVVLEFER